MCCAAESTAIPVGRLKYPSPPFRLSKRRARDCTAGAFETLANNSLVAAIAKSCAKQDQRRRRGKPRQGGTRVTRNRSVAPVATSHFFVFQRHGLARRQGRC